MKGGDVFMKNDVLKKLRYFLHSFMTALRTTLEIVKLIADIMNSK